MISVANVGLSVYGGATSATTPPQQTRPLSPRPSLLSIGGATQNFHPKRPCSDCADGWVRQPDGYGCVEWTLCYRCGGDGFIAEDNDG